MRECSRSLAGVKVTLRLVLAGAPESDGPAVSKRPRPAQAESANAAHTSAGAAQRRPPCLPTCRPKLPVTLSTHLGHFVEHDLTRKTGPHFRGHALVTQQLYLTGPNQIDPRPGSRLDEAANPNP